MLPKSSWVALALVLVAPAFADASTASLTPEDVLRTVDIDNFVGLNPSPDGALAVFDQSDGAEALTYEYPNQIFSRSGYPMWSSLSIYRASVVDLRTGETSPLAPGPGVAWGGSWSPDGQRYAFYSDRSGQATLWVWNRRSHEIRQVSDLVVRMFRNTERPVWSPDGKRILFKVLAEGMSLRDLEQLDPAYRKAQGKPASSATLTSPVEVTEMSTLSAVAANATPPAAARTSFIDYRYSGDLAIAGVDDGTIVRITHGLHPMRFDFSPDGKWVAMLDIGGFKPHTQKPAGALWLFPAGGGSGRVLDDDVASGDPEQFSWSPDSQRIAYASQAGDTTHWRSYVVTLSGERREASAALHAAALRLDRIAPIWSPDGAEFFLLDTVAPGADRDAPAGRLLAFSADGRRARALAGLSEHIVQQIVTLPNLRQAWSPDHGRSIVLRTHATQTQKDGFCRLDLKSSKAVLLAEYDALIHQPLVAPASASTFVYFREDIAHPVEAWTFDPRSAGTTQLTHLSAGIDGKTSSQASVIHWTSARGEALSGALLLPVNYVPGKRYPLMVWMYGGDYGSTKLNRFGFGWGALFNAQLYAAHGYAVLYPDIPLHVGATMSDMASAVMPGIDKAIELGVADADKLAVSGQSFGGYGTMSMLVQTNRFKAAVANSAAAINLFEGYSRYFGDGDMTGYYETGQGHMNATPWQEPARYHDNSPFFFLDKVRTPLMLQRGGDDWISQDMGGTFNALKRLQQDVVYLEYAHEGHVLQQPQNVVDFWKRRYAFLDRYIAPEPRE